MTNQEAINVLKMVEAHGLAAEAKKMAIEALMQREADDHKELYICDPSLYKECPKKNCHINGGPCRHTIYKQFAVKKEELKCPYTNKPCDDWDCYWCEKGQGDG